MRVADEAFALNGARAAETYLDIGKLLDVARRSGADAVHPGYGFLAENAGFAQAVIDAGLVWIGPPPSAIDALGDKVSARHIAQRAGAPLVAGHARPGGRRRRDPRVRRGARSAGRHQGGVRRRRPRPQGRPRRRARSTRCSSRPPARPSAAFGRGECFVERYLDRPRHVETQCLADEHGTVVVVSTRDCSLQRRHQKLVEEAPAPFLTDAQNTQLVESSKAILREAGYVGAGTCEFLVAPTAPSRSSRSTRACRWSTRSPRRSAASTWSASSCASRPASRSATTTSRPAATRSSSGSTARTPAAGFLPAPGRITPAAVPVGPRRARRLGRGRGRQRLGPVRLDDRQGHRHGRRPRRRPSRAPAARWPRSRSWASPRSSRSTARCSTPRRSRPPTRRARSRVHTRWIETEFADTVAALSAAPVRGAGRGRRAGRPERVVVEVGGKRLEVVLPAALALGRGRGRGGRGSTGPAHAARRGGSRAPAAAATAPR